MVFFFFRKWTKHHTMCFWRKTKWHEPGQDVNFIDDTFNGFCNHCDSICRTAYKRQNFSGSTDGENIIVQKQLSRVRVEHVWLVYSVRVKNCITFLTKMQLKFDIIITYFCEGSLKLCYFFFNSKNDMIMHILQHFLGKDYRNSYDIMYT